MKKLLSMALLCLTAATFAQSGKILEGLSMKSEILPYDVNYCVYLPPDYDSSENRRYPVVYLLHGYGDEEWGWVQFGEIKEAADKAIAEREITPMIIIMPDGKVTFYINNADGKDNYEDMFIKEFIPFIDDTYRTRVEKRSRGIAGLSMGGWGTLTLAMRYPDLFSACAAYSSAVWSEEELTETDWDRFMAAVCGPKENGDIPQYFRERHPLDIVKTGDVDELKKVRYYIDCGDDDFLIAGNCALHVEMKKKGIPHEFRVREGRHSWVYWRTGIIPGLQFIGDSFHQH